MIGFLVKLGVLLVLGVLVYNYFFGTPEEQAQSSKAFDQMKDVAVSVGELAKAEKQKFDAGKYDAALDKLGAAYRELREGARQLDARLLDRVEVLEQRKARLGEEVDRIRAAETAARDKAGQGTQALDRRKAELQRELDALKRDSDALLKESRQTTGPARQTPARP